MKYVKHTLPLWLVFLLIGCGSAEAIKIYSYPVKKTSLEKAVVKVLKSNPNIVVDTSESIVIVRRNPDDMNDTSIKTIKLSEFRGHSKDSADIAANEKAVMRIKITVGELENNYVFRYLGDEHHWNISSGSEIFIQYAKDKQGNSISQGNNENGEFNSKLAKDLTSLFETEVVSKIDKELNLKHTVN